MSDIDKLTDGDVVKLRDENKELKQLVTDLAHLVTEHMYHNCQTGLIKRSNRLIDKAREVAK